MSKWYAVVFYVMLRCCFGRNIIPRLFYLEKGDGLGLFFLN